MNKKSKIIVFIPGYRCESQISRVLEQFDDEVQKKVHSVLFVDNRSPDNTLVTAIEDAKRRFRRSNFIASLNDENYSLGGSHKVAFKYAIENNFDYLVVLHGDDQANIKDLFLLDDFGTSDLLFDCYLGARFMSGSKLSGYSKFRIFGNHLFNFIFSCLTMRKIYDLGSGLNLYKVSTFKDFYYKNFPDDLTFNIVMLLDSFRRKQNIKFFPISWREDDQLSNVKLFTQAIKTLSLLINSLINRKIFFYSDMRYKKIEKYTSSVVFEIKNI